MMVPREKSRLGDGLPARFAGDQGFSRLCGLLEINREERKAIVGAIRRARTSPIFGDLSTKERHRFYITYFYSQPVERRVLWKKTLAAIDEPGRHPPSLELRALLAYDPECLDREVNDQDIASALADVPDLLESTASVPDWQRPALAVWPGLRDEVLGWAACSPERRDAVVAALFAVATILDDVRLFGWAAEQARELAAEFAFALDSRTTEENVADEGQVLPALGSSFLRKWKASWARVVSLAAALETVPPQPVRSEDEGRLMAAIGELQAALQTIEANRPEKLVERVPDTIAALADEYDAPWLQAAVDQIRAQWKLTRLAVDVISVDRLRAEIDRVERELPDVLRAWSHSRNEIERLEAKLRETPEQPPGDLTSLLRVEGRKKSLLQAILECQARTDDCTQRVLQTVAPDGCEFEPSRDYASEWSEKSAVSAGGAAGPEAVPKPDDAGDETVAREQQGAASDHSASMDPTERADTTTDTDATDGEPAEPAIPASSDIAPSQVRALDDAGVLDPLESGDGGQVPVEPTAPSGTTMPPSGAGRHGGEEGEAPSASKAVAALWRFLVDRPGIAYHLGLRLSDRYGSEPALPPPDLLAAALLADHVRSADDRIAEALKKHLGRVDLADLSREDREIEIRHSLHLLLFCATVRPALIVPATGAAALLRRVNLPDLAPVCDLATAVAERAERLQRIRLDVSLFGAAFSQSGWSERMEGLRARTQDWLGRARNQRILYGPAHRVWKHWLGESSRLRTLAGLITEANSGKRRAVEVEEICEELRAPKSFRKLVEDTDSAIRTLKRGSIEGRALPALQQHVQPLLGLADEWLRLVAVKPDPKMNFVERNLDALRRTVVDSGGHAAEAIEEAATTAVAGPFGSTLKRAKMTVSALGRLFKDNTKSDIRYEDPDHILTRDLLYVTAADVDVRGGLAAVRDGADELSVLSNPVNHVETMRVAHETRLSRGDLVGARLAYREMEAAGDPEDDLEQCRALLDEAERKRRIELHRNRTELQEELEQLFCFGQIAEEDAVGLRADLVEVGVRLDDASAGDVGVLETRIRGIRRSISEYRNRGVTEAREKFGNLSARCDADARSRIEQAIDQGDLLTANELMSRIETGEGLDSGWQDQDDPLRDFMSAVEGIERSRGAPNGPRPDVVVRAVKNREAVAGLRFDAMSESEAEHASQLISAWYRLSREKRFDKETVENLLALLGMPVRRSRMEKNGRDWARINLETDALQDRSRCPLPQFGSAAGGRYSLLLDWGTSARESIPQIMGRGNDLATIVLHFGCLGTDREWLRSWAVDQHRLALVVDETLALFLSSRGSGRLPALFHCALPFTDVGVFRRICG